MQPHVFCGPEFLLAIPEQQLEKILQTLEDKSDDQSYVNKGSSNKNNNRSSRVHKDVLLQWQADIYSICTPRTRRALHKKASTSSSSTSFTETKGKMLKLDTNPFIHAGTSIASGLKFIAELNSGPIPSSSTQLQFVEIKYDGEMSSEEKASFQHSIKLAEQQQQQQQQQQQSKEDHNTKENHEKLEYSKEETNVNASSRHQSISFAESTTSTASLANNKFVYLLLYLTDSRVAAEVYMLLLRNVYLSLSGQCRMYNYFRLTSRAAPVVLSELLHNRELLRSHYNLDADLWSAVHDALTSELRNEILTENTSPSTLLSNSNSTSINVSGRLLTAAEEHHNAIKRVLHYCESYVQYAAVLDENEEASPFLCAFYFANELHITCGDLLQFFIRHPRRVIRVLALFLARYLLPPEELPVVFYGALFDEVVIACSADLQLTLSVKEIAHALLKQDEFNEAWLPALHKYWMEQIVMHDIDDMTALYNEHQNHKVTLDSNETNDTNKSNKLIQEVKGSGKGIAGTLGFHSIKDLARHAEMHQEQMFVPQRMVTLVARQRGIYDDDEYIHSSNFNVSNKFNPSSNKLNSVNVENDMNNDMQLEEEEETRDFFDEYLIDIEVVKSEGTNSNGSNIMPGLESETHNYTNRDGSHKRSRDDTSSLRHQQRKIDNSTTLHNAKDTDNKVITNEQVNVFRKGERLILSLLGRTTPIRPHDPVYL